MGVLLESPHLVAQMVAIFAEETETDLSYPVTLDKGSVRWLKVIDGKQTILRGEPDAGFTRRATAWLIGWLPLESQL
jgi:putative cardiolipin synthase